MTLTIEQAYELPRPEDIRAMAFVIELKEVAAGTSVQGSEPPQAASDPAQDPRQLVLDPPQDARYPPQTRAYSPQVQAYPPQVDLAALPSAINGALAEASSRSSWPRVPGVPCGHVRSQSCSEPGA